MAQAGDKPRFLVVHEDGTSLLAIKRDLERAGVSCVGARTPDAALDRIGDGGAFDAVLVHWGLPDLEAGRFAFECRQQQEPRPVLLAFHTAWGMDDIRRAMQLDVSAFLTAPVKAKQILDEHERLDAGQHSTRYRLLEKNPALLNPDPELWTGEAVWLEAMRSAAGEAQALAEKGPAELALETLSALDQADIRQCDLKTGKALLHIANEGPRCIESLSQSMGLGATRLRRLYRAASEVFAPGATGEAARNAAQLVLSAVVELLEERQGNVSYSPAYRRLRQTAADLFLEPDRDPRDLAGQRFISSLATLLRIHPAEINRLPPPIVLFIAARVLNVVEPRETLDVARLTLLSGLLASPPKHLRTIRCIETVGRILGCGAAGQEGLPDRLLAVAALVDDRIATFGLERASLDAINQTLARLTAQGGIDINPVDLAKRLDHVLGGMLPNSQVTQRRLGQVVDALERAEVVQISNQTARAIYQNLNLPTHLRGNEATILWQALGAMDAKQEKRALQFMQELPPDISFTSADLEELLSAAADAREFAGFVDGFSQRPRTASADSVHRAERRAYLVSIAEELDLPAETVMEIGLDEIADALQGPDLDLDIPPDSLTRLRGAGALLLLTDSDEDRARGTARFIEAYGDDPTMLAAMMQVLDVPGSDAVRSELRAELGLRPELAEPKDVTQLLLSENLRGALYAAQELSDEDPKTVPALNRLGMACVNAGRTPEAITLYQRAIELQPNRLSLQLNLGKLWIQEGETEMARQLLEQVHQAAPGFGNVSALLEGLGGVPSVEAAPSGATSIFD